MLLEQVLIRGNVLLADSLSLVAEGDVKLREVQAVMLSRLYYIINLPY